jgi:hypothetical protein
LSDYLVELARKIQKNRPEATIPVVIELTAITDQNIETLSSKGISIRRVIKPLRLVAGDISANPDIAEAVRKLKIVKEMDIASDLEILG